WVDLMRSLASRTSPLHAIPTAGFVITRKEATDRIAFRTIRVRSALILTCSAAGGSLTQGLKSCFLMRRPQRRRRGDRGDDRHQEGQCGSPSEFSQRLPSRHSDGSRNRLAQQVGLSQPVQRLPDDGFIRYWVELILENVFQVRDRLFAIAALPDQGGGAVELVDSVSL